MTVQYHWADAPNTVINPPTFTPENCDIALPAGATLRKLLVAEPLFYWKRGSVSSDDQEMYFVNYRVVYGLAEDAPVIYRSTRTLKHDIVTNAVSAVESYYSQWYGADAELGINEKLTRGGYYAPAETLRLTWSIYSSGEGVETLAGQANVDFRALYSTIPAP